MVVQGAGSGVQERGARGRGWWFSRVRLRECGGDGAAGEARARQAAGRGGTHTHVCVRVVLQPAAGVRVRGRAGREAARSGEQSDWRSFPRRKHSRCAICCALPKPAQRW